MHALHGGQSSNGAHKLCHLAAVFKESLVVAVRAILQQDGPCQASKDESATTNGGIADLHYASQPQVGRTFKLGSSPLQCSEYARLTSGASINVHHVDQALYTAGPPACGGLISVEPGCGWRRFSSWRQCVDGVKGAQELICSPQRRKDLGREVELSAGRLSCSMQYRGDASQVHTELPWLGLNSKNR